MKEKVVYNSVVRRLVLDIYGENSEIFKTMMNGEKISRLVKQSLKTKGHVRSRMGDKKKLFELCKKLEEKNERLESEISCL